MRVDRFTQKMQEALQAAQSLAADRGHAEFDNEHFLLALLDQPEGLAQPLFEKMGVKVDALSGNVIWRTESIADRVLAVNEEFAYVQDRLGNLLVYDARKPTDPETLSSVPLARLPVVGFNVPVTNAATDRLFLTADSGMLVCLRDASAKYARPVRTGVQPIVTVAAPAKAAPAAPPPPADEPPKKEEPKKEPPKKDVPKKDVPKKQG